VAISAAPRFWITLYKTTMKTTIFLFLMFLTPGNMFAQSDRPIEVRTSNNKVFLKYEGHIISQNSEDALKSFPKSNNISTDKWYEAYSKIYLLNNDNDAKKIFKSVFTPEMVDEYKDERFALVFRFNNTGEIISIAFFLDENKKLYSMCIDNYEFLENKIKELWRFNISDKDIPLYNFTFPVILANLYTNKPLFNESVYKER